LFLTIYFYIIRENGQLKVLSAHHQSGGVLQSIIFLAHLCFPAARLTN
jgi:hypothetical protein